MQVQANTSADTAITSTAIDNQIQIAVAVKARQVQKQQGEALVELIQDAAAVTSQLDRGHIDIQL